MKNRIIITAVFASILAMSALFASTEAEARCCWRGGYWVAPALIGGAVVYAATRPAQPPSVVYVPNPNPQVLPPPPMGYHYEQILDANCNCYRWVLVQG